MPRQKAHKTAPLDPLYVIFEQHLYNFADSNTDRKTFIGNIVLEYIDFLRKKGISVPSSFEYHIHEELGHQVNRLLTRKIYGCLTLKDYLGTVEPTVRRQAKSRYQKLRAR